ncbi:MULTISPECIES: response regulator transcription factor [Cyanophyceae]|uniref:response regulator transcription factor n=1 Tax=Cyanophyceae TaxID=3028117 RepID=UPI001687B734|nr:MULTISPECIES: response regulator transcription factor [Cyanophyceae]MBD1915394.1 response regulator transcription factor [Phormidium sp. FACHB-77]MBD2032395.1 response regulator transcription factor [Phormidium sp. FACHB-322]MBD2052566.1 response regulator transcription factor [Leptolyngbya sp. FACHB-60]
MPLTILIAEDDEGTRLALCDYLELEGYSVLMASHGEMALSQVFSHQPQLIITDIGMPGLDGFTLVQKVRQYPAFRLLPVIFLTAHNQTQDRIRGYQLGCDLYLPKPFELREIGAIVRNLLERSQLIQSAWIQQVALSTAQQRALQSSEVVSEAIAPWTPDPADLVTEFTAREQDVLTLLSDGLSNAQIGDRLFLSPRTVEKYVSSLLRKTETSNRSELLRFAISHHLVP